MKKTLVLVLALVMALSVLSLSAFAKGETNYVTGSTVDGPAYKDTYNGNLADGQVGTNSYDNLWAGFYNNQDNPDNNYDGATGVITVNFGEKKNAIDSIEAHIWDAKGVSGIASPSAIRVYASLDGENYAYLGDLTFGAEAIDWAVLELDTPVNAQYVKYEFIKESDGVFMFVSEVAVYGTPDGTGTDADQIKTETPDESVPEDESVPATESTPADESVSADDSAPANTSADNSEAGGNDAGNNTVLWVVLGVVAVVVIVAVIVVATKKKK